MKAGPPSCWRRRRSCCCWRRCCWGRRLQQHCCYLSPCRRLTRFEAFCHCRRFLAIRCCYRRRRCDYFPAEVEGLLQRRGRPRGDLQQQPGREVLEGGGRGRRPRPRAGGDEGEGGEEGECGAGRRRVPGGGGGRGGGRGDRRACPGRGRPVGRHHSGRSRRVSRRLRVVKSGRHLASADDYYSSGGCGCGGGGDGCWSLRSQGWSRPQCPLYHCRLRERGEKRREKWFG